MKKPASRRKQAYATPIFEGLEPRILLSADLPGLDVLTHDSQAESESSISSILSNAESEVARINSDLIKTENADVQGDFDNTGIDDKDIGDKGIADDDAFLASPDVPPALSYELAFIDSTVPDYQQLIEDLQLQSTDTRIIDVVILDADRSGIEQISDALNGYSNLNAIHIISHGADGAVDLGNTQLNNQSLAEHSEQLQAWGASLDGEADILFYGCDLAATSEGRALIDQIANLTGADIAASDDLTGSADLGGDWDLEYVRGELETNLAIGATLQQNWDFLLAATVDTTSTGASNGEDILVSHTTSGSDRLMMIGVTLNHAGASDSVSSITYNGGSANLIGIQKNGDARVEIWALVAPDLGTYDVDVKFSANSDGVAVGVTTFTGVDQTTPLGTFASNSGTSGSASLTVTSATDELVYGLVAADDPADYDLITGAGTDQVDNWDAYGFQINAGGSTKAGDATPVGMSWTWTGSDAWSTGGVSIKAAPNNAPVLDDTQTPVLTAVDEDAGTPVGAVGSLVSELVDFASPSGQVDNVTDADSGADLGIAITAADTTNGSWFYSIDNGSNWNALGVVSESSARLLAADADTRIYFQGDANYNGTLANAITFHAWDQTTGSNGGTENLTPTSYTMRDQFDTVSFSNSDGTVSWNSDWQEIGESDGTGSGRVRIGNFTGLLSTNEVALDTNSLSTGISRSADLSSASSAVLSFDYGRTGAGAGSIDLEIHDGTSWNLLNTFTLNVDDTVAQTYSEDISAYADANTQIRFVVTNTEAGSRLYLDNVQIGFDAVAGGTTAFSSASDTASLVVNPVNDAPTAADNTVSTNEDVDYIFDAADFNFSDPDSGDSLQQVRITALPANGTLQLSGVDVDLNQIIGIADINLGNLVFVPNADENGTGYANFEFEVSDGVSTGATGTELNSFPTTTPQVNSMSGLAFDGTGLWLTSPNDDAIYNYDTAGNLVISFASPGTFPTGITFDGTNLWVVDRDANMVYEIDTLGNVQSSFATPGTDSRGLTWDGSSLWLVEGSGSLIYKLSTTGSIISSFAWPDDYLRDITWDGSNLWVADGNDQQIIQIDTSGNTISSFASPSTHATGLTFDGVDFWHADADSDTVYQLAGSNSVGYSASAYTMTLNVTAVNDAPVNSVPATQTVIEETTTAISGISIADVDDNGGLVMTRLQVSNGALNVTLSGGASIAGGSNDSVEIYLQGTVTDINNTLASLTYTGNTDVYGTNADTLTVTTFDGGNTGSGGSLNDIDSFQINITNVNDAPVITGGPATGSLTETNTTLTDSGTLTVSDADTTDLVTASVETVAVSGTGSTSLSNAALKTMLSVAPTAILDGTQTSDTLTWSFDSGAEAFNELATGETLILTYTVKAIDDAGTPLSDTETVTITITGSNDAPTGQDKTIVTPEDTVYTFTLTDFGYSDVDGDAIALVKVFPIAAGDFVQLDGVVLAASEIHDISISDINNGKLTFNPPADAVGTAPLLYFGVNDGTVDSVAKTISVEVTAVNDAPVATADPGNYSNEIQVLNPLSYWRLGEAAGAADDLGSSANSGTYNGGTLSQSGAISGDTNTAVHFNGSSDYVAIAHSDDYLIDDGTIQLWFNADNVANGDLQHLFSKDSQGNDTGGHVSMYLTATGSLEVRMQSALADYILTSTSTVSQGNWHHAALSFGGDGMELYLDGQLVDSDVYTGGLGTTSGDIGNYEQIAIGGGTQNSGDLIITPVNQFFTGFIDEVAILDGQLSSQSIQQLYDSGRNQFQLDEDATLTLSATSGVLANDTDVDGDTLTVTEINGNAASIGNPLTLASGALVTLNADGSLFYNPNGQFETLNSGDTTTDSFSYTVNDGFGETDTTTVTISITGVNDAPVITGGPATSSLSETNATLTDSGTLTVSDVDTTDLVTASVDTVAVTGTGSTSLSNAALKAMLSVAPTAILDGTETSDTLTWSFDSGTEAFNELATGETLILTYTVKAIDDAGTPLSDTETVTITITGSNDDPTAANNTVTTNEDATYTFAASDFNFADIDDDTLGSVEITSLESAGDLQLNNVDVTLNQVITKADIDANKLKFIPVANANGNAYDSFGFSVNDGTADSTASYTMTVNVTAVNDAPVLNTAASPTLTSITEDAANPTGDTIAALVVDGSITDADGSAVEAIAITSTGNGYGSWEYSVNGGTNWNAVGTVSPSSALLLAATDMLRYIPDGQHGETQQITYRAWDQSGVTAGLHGTKVSTVSNGGITPFSSALETASITVTAINDTPAAVNDAYSVDEDGTLNSSATWFDDDWTYRRTLSFDNLDQTEDLANFPVLVKLDATRIDYTKTSDAGEDLRFVDADGNLLAHQVEQWDESGTSYVWVKVAQVDGASSSDFIHMYYGNVAAVSAEGQVWSEDYQAVYHLNEAAGVIADSTANSFDGSNNGSVDGSGFIGNGQVFNGSNQWIDLGSQAFLNNTPAATLSAWIKTDTLSGSGDIVSVSVDTSGGASPQASRAAINQLGDEVQVVLRANDANSGDVRVITTTTSPLAVGEWHYVSAVIDYANDSLVIYVDGVEQTLSGAVSFTNTATPNTDSSYGAIGSNEAGANSFFDGSVDEVRIANTARSADWMAAQYASMSDHFVTISAEQTAAGVLDNDIDPEGDSLTVNTTPISDVTNGTLLLNADGSFSYTPDADFNGSDSFTYQVSDGNGGVHTATVTLTVNAVNDAPVLDASEANLWFSTTADVSGSSANGLANWSDGEMLEFAAPDLTFGENTTDGTLSSTGFNLDTFAGGDADIDALHYVTQTVTVGSGISAIDLLAGDLLLSTQSGETLSSTNSLTVTHEDIFIFRPDTPGDYSAGTFTFLLDKPTGGGATGISLVEQNTLVGDVTLEAGTFVLAKSDKTIYHYSADTVGETTTTGTLVTLVDAADIGIDKNIAGVSLVQNTMTTGGVTLNSGQLLVTLVDEDNNVGGFNTERRDIIALTITQTGTTTLGSASGLFFDGDNVGLSSNNEDIDALTLVPQPRLTPIVEDISSAANSGTLVSDLIANLIMDFEGDPDGIAITTLDETNGSWEYSIDGGSNWQIIDTVTDSSARVLTATASDLIRFVPTADFSGNASFSFRAWDGSDANISGASGIDASSNGGVEPFSADALTASIEVRSVNDAPVLINSGADTTLEGTTRVFNAANANLISITDVDAGTDELEVSLSVTYGSASLSATSGLTFSTGDGVADASMVFRGTLADLNSALDGLSYTPIALYTGDASLNIQVNELRNSYLGTNLFDQQTLAITITPDATNDAPVNTVPGPQVVDEDTWLELSVANGNAISIVDDSGNNPIQVTLTAGNGVLTLDNRLGSEFTINSTTAGTQKDIQIITTASGTGIAVWNSKDQDGSGEGIFAQLYDADGVALGAEFQVNSYTADHQKSPAVAAAADGSFVVVWQSKNQDSDGEGIYGQRFDAAANTLGSEFKVNSTTADNQKLPAVAMNASGEFVVTWQSKDQDGDGEGIYAQRYDNLGNSVGGELLVNATTADNQKNPDVAIDTAGNFVVVWDSKGQDVSGEAIIGRRFDSSSGFGTEFQINTYTSGGQKSPVIEMQSTGEFVVAWTSDNEDGSRKGVFAQRFDDSALPVALGTEISVNTTTLNDQKEPAISMNASGEFVIAWQSKGQDNLDGKEGIYAQHFAADGSSRGGEFQVNTTTLGGQKLPSVSLLDDGSLWAAWENTEIFSQRFQSPDTLTFSVGDGVNDATMTFSGSQTDINAALDGLRYFSTAGGLDTVTITTNDNGHSGGGALTDTDSFNINVSSVNDAPVITVPDQQSATEDVPFVFSAGNGNLISVNDIDAGAGLLELTLTATNGTLTLNGISGLAFSVGDGSDDAALTFQGTLADINTALDGLTFTTPAEFVGIGMINVAVDDLGNTGTGSALTDSAVIYVDVLADGINDAPVIWAPGDFALPIDTLVTFDGANLISIDDDAGINPIQVTLTATNGTLTVNQQSDPELLVNTVTSDAQLGAVVAAAPNGAYVVVWQSDNQDGSGNGIFAQIYDAFGDAQGSEILVNTETAGNQITPTVAMDSQGNFVVAWESDGNLDSDGRGIFVQLFTVNGEKVDIELQGNTNGVDDQTVPAVAMDDAGNFVLVWQSKNQDGNGEGIFAQRFDSTGAAIDDEFQVNSTFANNQTVPAVAMDADGDFVVVWQSTNQDGDGDGIYAQQFNADGTAEGIEFRVNFETVKNQRAPAVAIDGTGNFVVAWQSENQDGDGYGIYARRFDATGIALDPADVLVNSEISKDQIAPSISMNAAGEYIIAWQSQDQDTNGEGAYGQWFNASGSAIGGEVRLNTTVSNDQTAPSVAITRSGDYIAAWTSTNQDGSSDGVYSRQVANPEGLTFTTGDGNSDTVIVVTGQAQQINNALNGMTFTPNSSFNGLATVQIDVDDLGNTGTGGPYTDAHTIEIVYTTAPVLNNTGTPSFTTIDEDAINNTGDLVSALLATGAAGDPISDSDAGAQEGIAVTAVDNSNGTWQFSANGGGSWTAFTSVTESTAVLLGVGVNDRIRFVPASNYNGSVDPGITFRAWDQSNERASGTTGVDTTTNGGNTPYSSATETASITINSVNDAPELTDGLSTSTTKGGSGAPFAVNFGSWAQVSDVDGADFSGGTLTASISSGGEPTDVLRLAPSGGGVMTLSGSDVLVNGVTVGNWSGGTSETPLIVTFNANADATDVQAVYKRVAFSNSDDYPVFGTRTLSVVVTDGDGGTSNTGTGEVTLNDVAPTATNRSAAESYTEDTPLDLTDIVISDNDSANVTATLTLSNTTAGSLNTGTSNAVTSTYDAGTGVWSASGATADVNALLAGLSFTPASDFNADFTIATSISDGVAAAITGTKTMTGSAVNDAPTLGSGTLTSVAEDTANPTGEAVSDIFTGQFADIDTGSSFGGIAVTGNSANAITQGSWQYSTNAGSDWFAIGTVADDATALVLSDSTLIRFMPVADYYGTPTALEVRGLDDSYTGGFSATAGSETRVVVDTTSNGGITAIAASAANLSTAITAVADTASVTDATTDEDTQSTTGLVITPNGADGAEVTHFKVTGIANGTLYKNDGTTQINDGDFITVAEGAAGLKFTPAADFNGDGSFTTQASTSNVDAGLGGSTADATITVNPVNDAPIVDLDSDNSSGAGGANYTTIFTEDGGPVALSDVLDASLSDPDLENLVSLTVTIANPLDGANEWLAADTTGTAITASYDSSTGVLSLTGADSAANYQQVLRSLTYDNTSDDPDITARVITVVANDGTVDSNTVTWNPPATQGLVGYWNFDEGMDEQAFDLSGNGNHATLTNTTLAADWVEGNAGQALNFTGTEDYVEVPYSDELKLDGDFTITLWNKPDSVDTRTRVVAEYGNTQWQTDGWMINQYGDDLYWYHQSSGPTSQALNVFAVDQWTHIAISRSGDTFTLYVDGVQRDQDTKTGVVSGNHSLYFGSGAGGQNFDGTLDDVRIYDQALSAGEIDAVYQDRGATTVVNMVAANDAPLVTSSAGTTAYSEQAAATIIDSGIALVDADGFNGADPSDQYTAVIRLTANYETADILGFTNTSNIQGVLTGDLLTLSVITGQTATLAEFETALRAVTFYNNSDTPGEMDRTITFSFDDGVDSSNLSTKTIQVTALNDDPTNVGVLQSASVVTEDISSTIDLSAINLSDADAGAGVLTMTLTSNTGGNLTAAAGTGITIGGNGSGTLTLEGTQTDLNAYLDAVGKVTYLHGTANTSGFAADTIQVDITDNGNTGSGGGGTITLGTFNIDITAVNDAPIAVNDRPGLNFDGIDDYINIPDATSLIMTNTLTLEAWINLDVSTASEHMILNKEGEYEIAVLNGTLQWGLANTTPGWSWHDTGEPVLTNQWTHIAFSYNNGDALAYINGVLIDTYNGSGPIGDAHPDPDKNDLRVGGRSNNPDGKYFDGQIADVRIWNTVRTDVEINANQNATLSGSETGLVGYWLLNDGSSTTAIDSSLEGNDGLLGGGVATQEPTWSDFSVDEDGTLTVTAPGVLSNDFDADGDTLTVNTTPTVNVSNGVLALSSDGSFVYTPNVDFNGVDSFTYEISDGEGGTDTAEVSITVNPVNDAPNLTAGATLDYSEGDAATIIDSTITLADVDDTMLESATIQITGNLQPGKDILTRPAAGGIPGMSWIPSTGTLTLTGTATVAQYQAVLRSVTFENTSDTPSELTRTITWTVNDGNVDSAPQTSTITVNSVNDAPTGADNTVTTNEDTDYTFTSIDFGFSDSNDSPGDDLLNVIITTAPNNGTLYVDSDNDGLVGIGESLADGATVSATDISAGQLKFKPASDANGTAYDSFTFQVQDDGGVANGGINTDQSANTITINVTAQADAASITVTAADTAVTEDDAGNNTANGTVTITDVDTGEGSLTSSTATYGTVSVDGSGNWSYALDNSNATVQALAASDTLADSITFTSDDGTTQTQSITITGANDTATISVTAADTAVTEDDAGNNTANGTVTVTDVDTGEGSLTSSTASYGTVTVDGSGNWSYALDNSNAAVQALAAGDTLSDSITFTSDDGTTQTQSITITGANDAASISVTAADAAVTEDDAGNNTANGTVSITDTDTGEGSLTSSTASYGTVTVDGSGNWSYALDNSDTTVQALAAGDTLADSITFTSDDGTTQTQSITITGANDTATISVTAADTAVNEDDAGNNTASGTVTVSDVDTGEASLTSSTATYGTVSVDGSGNWSYALDNSNATVNALAAGDTLTDSITFTSDDGTTQTQSITITGANDTATISVIAADTAVTEDDAGNNTASGTVTITDVDSGEGSLTSSTASYGTVTVDGSGNWSYALDNSNATVQALAAGDTLTDSITFTSDDGTTQTQSITITGANDTATIIVTAADTAVTEDDAGNNNASGTVTITDVDTGEASLTSSIATYGTVSVDGSGNWSYALDNSNNTVNALAAGDTLTDSITFTSDDGTTQTQSITITGANDAAVIGGDTSAAVNEDGTLTDTGALTISDNDDEAVFITKTAAASTSGYGSVDLDDAGNWTYSLNNAHATVQALSEGEILTDSFTATSADGSTQVVNVTITGKDDAASLGGNTSAAVSEDGTLTDTGALTISDTDDGEAVFTTQTSAASTSGYGSVDLDDAGNWTYSLNNAHATVQALSEGEILTDSFTATSADGSTQVVNVTITGKDDAASLGGDTSAAVSEDGTFTDTGALTISDTDDGEAVFTAQPSAASTSGYGTVDLDAAGSWTYTLSNGNATVQALSQGETLADSFTATSADGSTQVVNVTITGKDDRAVISGDSSFNGNEGDTVVGDLNATDIEGLTDSTYFSVTSEATMGTAVIDAESGAWSFTPAKSNWFGNDSFEVTVTDDEGGTTSQTISITLANVEDSTFTTDPVTLTPEAVTPASKPTVSPVEEAVSDNGSVDESDEAEFIDTSSNDEATDNTETGNLIDVNTDDTSGFPAPIEANDIFVSVLSDRPTTIKSFEDTKPTVEITQTFLQELASFWKDDGLSVMQPDETGRNSPEFINDVNKMLTDLDNAADIENKEMKMSAEAITGVSITLTAGFVSWALRAGSLVASFLAVMPAWRNLDPMPILAADEKSRRKLSPLDDDDDFDEILDEDTEKTVDDLFDR